MRKYKITRTTQKVITTEGKTVQDVRMTTTATGFETLQDAELSVMAYEMSFVNLNVIQSPVDGTYTSWKKTTTFNTLKDLGYSVSTVCNIYGGCVHESVTVSQTIERYE